MIFALSMALSVLVAMARGAKLSALAPLRFKGLHFLVVAVVLRLLLVAPPLQAKLVEPFVADMRYGGLLYTTSLLLTLLTLVSNVQLPGLKVITLGMFSNFLVIAANLGQMPGVPSLMAVAGYSAPPPGRWSNFAYIGENTPLSYLGDLIFVPIPWHPVVVSIGDLAIILGVFWFFQRAMK